MIKFVFYGFILLPAKELVWIFFHTCIYEKSMLINCYEHCYPIEKSSHQMY